MELIGGDILSRPISSIYIGGGTPSLLPIAGWQRLIALIEKYLSISHDAEVSVEINPGAVSSELLFLLREWRTTRVSIGVQSLDDFELKILGRQHNAAEAVDTISAARALKFSVSLDLMFGLPYATFKNWARTLSEACLLKPHHISLYQLSIEDDSLWGESPPQLTDGYFPYRFAQRYLAQKGFSQYEVASFCLPGHHSRHNSVYWSDCDYLGIGASASGYIHQRRYRNQADLSGYRQKLKSGVLPIASSEEYDPVTRYRDASVLALRTSDGINWEVFSQRYGENAVYEIKSKLEEFPDKWVVCDDTGAHLTPLGFCIANQIWSELI